MEWFVENKAKYDIKLDKRTPEGFTPEDLAKECGHQEIAEMLKKERSQRLAIVFANLKRLDSRKIALLAFIIATAAAMSRCLWDLRRSRRICRISVMMNIAGNLREDGMMR